MNQNLRKMNKNSFVQLFLIFYNIDLKKKNLKTLINLLRYKAFN